MGYLRFAAVLCTGLSVMACKPAENSTVVSIEFDDAHVEQLLAFPLLSKYDMKATFFLLHPRLEKGGQYLTLENASSLQAAGHEIGGHSLTHPRLTELSREQQLHEVCEDRRRLQLAGLTVDNFAYPSGVYDATTEGVVAECGYESARTSGGLCENPALFNFCDRAESVPPLDRFATRTHSSIRRERIPERMRNLIIDARENGGGWVQIIFHHICDRCDDYSITQSELDDFLSWLAAEQAADRVRVKTVREVIRGE